MGGQEAPPAAPPHEEPDELESLLVEGLQEGPPVIPQNDGAGAVSFELKCQHCCKPHTQHHQAIRLHISDDSAVEAGDAPAAADVTTPAMISSQAEADTPATPAGAPTADGAEPDFIAAKAFSGSMPGYAFKAGVNGQGYYRDAAAKWQTPGSAPSDAREGEDCSSWFCLDDQQFQKMVDPFSKDDWSKDDCMHEGLAVQSTSEPCKLGVVAEKKSNWQRKVTSEHRDGTPDGRWDHITDYKVMWEDGTESASLKRWDIAAKIDRLSFEPCMHALPGEGDYNCQVCEVRPCYPCFLLRPF